MWYLNRGGRLDMNVQDAWTQGVTGKGVSVTILDDGIEKSHPDLVANYDPLGEYHAYPLYTLILFQKYVPLLLLFSVILFYNFDQNWCFTKLQQIRRQYVLVF